VEKERERGRRISREADAARFPPSSRETTLASVSSRHRGFSRPSSSSSSLHRNLGNENDPERARLPRTIPTVARVSAPSSSKWPPKYPVSPVNCHPGRTVTVSCFDPLIIPLIVNERADPGNCRVKPQRYGEIEAAASQRGDVNPDRSRVIYTLLSLPFEHLDPRLVKSLCTRIPRSFNLYTVESPTFQDLQFCLPARRSSRSRDFLAARRSRAKCAFLSQISCKSVRVTTRVRACNFRRKYLRLARSSLFLRTVKKKKVKNITALRRITTVEHASQVPVPRLSASHNRTTANCKPGE